MAEDQASQHEHASSSSLSPCGLAIVCLLRRLAASQRGNDNVENNFDAADQNSVSVNELSTEEIQSRLRKTKVRRS